MSWPKVPIGEASDIVAGGTPDTNEPRYWGGDICWATPKDLSELDCATIADTPRKLTQAGLDSCSASVLPPGSVLFSSRAPIGHVAVNSVPMATNQGFKSFVPRPGKLDAKFLYYWLRAHRPQLEAMGNGATFKEVSKAVVERIHIPLPPLAEQKRIAAVLDKADALRAKRRQALATLDTLLQSVFLDMFGDPVTNPKGWPIVTIGNLVAETAYGSSAKAHESDGKFAMMRMNNLTADGRLDITDLKFIDLHGKEIDRYTVRRGDLLFNRTNSQELVGKTALYDLDTVMAYAGYLIRVRAGAETTPEYLWAFLNSQYAKRVLRGMCKQIIGMANINATELRSIRIPKPPLALQQRLSRLRESLRPIRLVHERAAARVDALFASLQSAAFAGTLFDGQAAKPTRRAVAV